jgi:L-fuculose-phosphate aldolase
MTTTTEAVSEATLRQQLTAISLRTYERGLVRGSGGNISARLDERRMLITPSGLALGDTTPDNIVCVDLQTGEWEAIEPYIPSKETGFHSEIYAARPDVGAIVHCHAPYATAYAVRQIDIPYVTDAAFKQPPMPHVPFAPSGTKELAQAVGKAARSRSDFRVMLRRRRQRPHGSLPLRRPRRGNGADCMDIVANPSGWVLKDWRLEIGD